MDCDIVLTDSQSTYSLGDTVAGRVKTKFRDSLSFSVTAQSDISISVNFVGQSLVKIQDKHQFRERPVANTVYKLLFRHVQTLYQGRYLSALERSLNFQFTFPDDTRLLPSLADLRIVNAGASCDASIDYYLEVVVKDVATNREGLNKRKSLVFIPPRFTHLLSLSARTATTMFASQFWMLNPKSPERRSIFRGAFEHATIPTAIEPKPRFLVHFVNSTEAVIGQKLPITVKLSTEVERSADLITPTVYLNALKITLNGVRTWYTDRTSSESNGLPCSFGSTTRTFIMDERALYTKGRVALQEDLDLSTVFNQLVVPVSVSPSINHPNLTIEYSLELQPEFECLKKFYKHDPVTLGPIRLLSGRMATAVQLAQHESLDTGDGPRGSISSGTVCLVCQRDLSRNSEEQRQIHIDNCLNQATAIDIPYRPTSILIIDDYSDYTSILVEAYFQHLRRTNEVFARCVGRVIWGERENTDILEHEFSRYKLRNLFEANGLSWARPRAHYRESEELRSYDYIIYAGQDLDGMRRKLRDAELIPPDRIRATELVNMESLIPAYEWPYEQGDVKTAWTLATDVSSNEMRLARQFQILKDCCLEFAWTMFKLRLPGLRDVGNVHRNAGPSSSSAAAAIAAGDDPDREDAPPPYSRVGW